MCSCNPNDPCSTFYDVCDCLLTRIQQNDPSLYELQLFLKDQDSTKFAEDVVPRLVSNTTVVNLFLWCKTFLPFHMVVLSKLLQTNHTIKCFEFRANVDTSVDPCTQHDADGFRPIFPSIERNEIHLHALTITNFPLSNESLLSLSRALKWTRHLRSLGLLFNQISEFGALILSRGLKANHTLTSILISYNPHMGEDGVEHILSSLIKHSSIEEIDLSHNWLGGWSVSVYLPLLLVKTPSLRAIYMMDNHCGPENMALLELYVALQSANVARMLKVAVESSHGMFEQTTLALLNGTYPLMKRQKKGDDRDDCPEVIHSKEYGQELRFIL